MQTLSPIVGAVDRSVEVVFQPLAADEVRLGDGVSLAVDIWGQFVVLDFGSSFIIFIIACPMCVMECQVHVPQIAQALAGCQVVVLLPVIVCLVLVIFGDPVFFIFPARVVGAV